MLRNSWLSQIPSGLTATSTAPTVAVRFPYTSRPTRNAKKTTSVPAIAGSERNANSDSPKTSHSLVSV